MRRAGAWLTVALALALAGVSGCGGGTPRTSSAVRSSSSASMSASTSASTSAPPPSSTPSRTATGTSAAVASGPVRASLRGQSHTPRAGRPWRYVLTVHAPDGHPLSGTVDVEFVLGPIVVGHDRPPVHRLRHGELREALTFPAAAVGHPIALQTVVHTSAGTVTLQWPVRVTR